MAREGDSLYSIRAYYQNQGGGNDGLHAPINNWFYWSWNANSGDTGGIVRSRCPSSTLHLVDRATPTCASSGLRLARLRVTPHQLVCEATEQRV